MEGREKIKVDSYAECLNIRVSVTKAWALISCTTQIRYVCVANYWRTDVVLVDSGSLKVLG